MSLFVMLISSLIAFTPFSTQAENLPPLEVVEFLDVEKYMGTWYEIARLPNRFQRQCAGTRVHYELTKKGRVNVLNTCQRAENLERISRASGRARIVDSETNAKLKVSFVPFLSRFGWFAGDYWVIALDYNYQYAMIGVPDRSFLWIISRSPLLSESTLEELLERAKEKKFDTKSVIRTPEWID